MPRRKEPQTPRRAAGESLREWREQLVQDELLPILIQIKQITAGERGERVVGSVLDELRSDGYVAIHSIHRDECDVDHVLVGPAGVFVIETKSRRGAGLITFRNGQGMFVAERPYCRKAIEQAKGGARWVSRIVREHCALSEPGFPIVVFVGNWQVADQWESTDVRVFTPESLRSYLRDQQPVLTRLEIELIASHLERSAKS